MLEPSPPPRDPPSVGAAGMRGRLLAGTGALFSSLSVWAVLQILAVPVFLDHWGTELYGQWLAINAGAGLLSLLDFGLSTHLVNRILAASARADGREVLRLLADGNALFAVLASFGLALLAVAWLVDLPSLIGIDTPDAGIAGALQATAILILLPRPLVGGLFAARGQFGRSVYLSAALQLVPFAAVLAVAAAGGGLAAAATVSLAAVVATGWILPLAVLRASHPDIVFALRWPAAEELKGYLRKSALYGLSSASSTAMLQVPVLILQALSPSGVAVVAFTTMRTAAGVLRQVAGQLVVSAALEMTRQHNQGDRAGLDRLFVLTGRVAGGSVGLLAGPLLVLGPPLFVLWTSGEVAFDLGLALVFVGAAIVVVPGTVSLSLLRHTDHAEQLASAHLVQIVVGVVLCVALAPKLGSLGAAIAVSAAEVLAIGGLTTFHALRAFALGAARVIVASWGAAAAGLAIGGAAGLALHAALPSGTVADMAWLATAWATLVAPVAPLLLLPRVVRHSLWHSLRARGGRELAGILRKTG